MAPGSKESPGDSARESRGVLPFCPAAAADDLPSPFDQLSVDLSDSELRETAYEILVAACCTASAKPLAHVAHSDRPLPSPPSLSSNAASKMRKALGIGSSSKKKKSKGCAGKDETPFKKAKKHISVGELMRVQMGISEQADSRFRKGLVLVCGGQFGRRTESMVLPLELMQHLEASDFSEQREYIAWKARNLKILEAGLLVHTFLPLAHSDAASQKLRQNVQGAIKKTIQTGTDSESMEALRGAVMSLACRNPDGSTSDFCHWADGFQLNLHLYQKLLEACFDGNEDGSIIDEIDDVLELIKTAWIILGINQGLHNLCFEWVLFHRFVTSGQVHIDLLFAADNQLAKIAKDAVTTNDLNYPKILRSTLSSLQLWTEKRLVTYHDSFNGSNTEFFEIFISLGVSAAKILAEDISDDNRAEKADVAYSKVDKYIRSSLRTEFAKRMKQVESNRESSQKHITAPLLSILAKDLGELAKIEKEFFSPILKKWHPLAAGVAAVTLHTCFGNELKKFISRATESTPDTFEILRDGGELEKYLVDIAVEDSIDHDDGGRSLIRQMLPYDAESAIANLVKGWIKIRVDRLMEWIDRDIQQENWNPKENRENCATSAVEVLLRTNETLDAYFQLPIQMHRQLIPDLLIGLDTCLQYYALKVTSGCGTRSNYLPPLPALTRCKISSKLWKKKDKSQNLPKRAEVLSINYDFSLGLIRQCVRMNSVQYLQSKLETLEKKIKTCLRNLESAQADILSGLRVTFEHALAACHEAILHLCETTAYKLIFQDLSHVLWDALYVGSTASSRIDSFLKELDLILNTISDSVHEKLRDRVITALMNAAFDGFLLVILAGGPARMFCHDDLVILEDFRSLIGMFLADGNGLPQELAEEAASQAKDVLPLFHTDTMSLIVLFNKLIVEMYGDAAKSKYPMPPTTGNWSSGDANTVLRVLCHRSDEVASKFLKRTYNLPKKITASKGLTPTAD